MVNFTPEHREHLLEYGWVSVDTGFSSGELTRYRDALVNMRARAVREAYPAGRIYWDYLGADNLAAIEAPLNDAILEPSIAEMFERLQLGQLTATAMGWSDSYCSLVRLFCMDNYKYRGHWHRDYAEYQPQVQALSSIQVAIYVEDQPGFRILRKNMEFDRTGSIFADESAANTVLHTPLYVNLPKETYVEAAGRAGTVMLFNPSIMHQGSSTKRRLDFHMRFHATELSPPKRAMVDGGRLGFKVVDFLSPSFSIDTIKDENLLPIVQRSSTARRLVNTVGYYSGLRNLVDFLAYRSEWMRLRNNPAVHLDFGANTVFQK